MLLAHIAQENGVVLNSGFTTGDGNIWLDEVNCIGTEARLIDCPARPLGQHDCFHDEDAGVECLRKCRILFLKQVAHYRAKIIGV